MESRVVLSVLLIAILSTLNECPNWQAAANMSDYLPQIRGFIDAAIVDGLTTDTIAENISDECNALWDTFWNVYVMYLINPDADVVLYGYAYREHWYWHNNYGSQKQSFVIWKDYNCYDVTSFSGDITYSEPDGSSSVNDAMQAEYDKDNSVANDIWLWAHNVIENQLMDYYAGQLQTTKQNIGMSAVIGNQISQAFSFHYCKYGKARYGLSDTPAPYSIDLYVSRKNQ